MDVTYMCETNIIHCKRNFRIEYYLVTDDGENYGIKSIMYENHAFKSANLFVPALSRDEAEQVIDMFCVNQVFPQSYADVLSDLCLLK